MMKKAKKKQIFKVVFEKLSRQGISVFPETLKKYKHQGWMSSVFTVKSKRGLLIIHLTRPVKEHRKNKVWEKFQGLSNILSSHPEIPTSRIIYSGLIGKYFVIAQFFIPGIRAGTRVLKDTVIFDKWKANEKNIISNVLAVLANIHKIQFRKFGWPIERGNQLEGSHKNWKNFFESNHRLWIRKIYEADKRLSLELDKKRLEKFIGQIIAEIRYKGPAVLVHGDSVNPSNILVSGRDKIAILDWEWSISADPAWEFCDLGWWNLIDTKSLEPYFEASNISATLEKIDFIKRIKHYIPLWLLWGTCMHADDAKLDIYIALRKLLLEKLAKI